MTEDQRVAAAIDIGSNSIKMTLARPGQNGGIEQLAWDSEVVRLGQGLDETGRLDDERIDHAVATLSRFAASARECGARRILAVATEATRSAANGADFLKRVESETGIEVRAIDGLEEAELTFRGLASDMDVSGQVVVADIGGASTELIASNDGVMLGARSVPLGSGRLTERLGLSDPPTLSELEIAEQEADATLARITKSLKLPRGEGARLIIVGGTGEFMTRLVQDVDRIDLRAVKSVIGKLAVLTAAELADAIEIPEARARVLPAGVAIVSAIANRVHPTRVEIARSGIRAGLLAEYFEEAGRSGAGVAEETSSRPSKPKRSTMPGVPVAAGKVRAESAEGYRETMKALIAERWKVVHEAIPAALEGADIEGVHDVRVASRRLRAAMDIAAPVFPSGWYKPLHRLAKEITRSLGEVRDRDVLLESLRAERDAAPMAEWRGIDRLIGRIEGERLGARAEMERYLHELLKSDVWSEVERRFGSETPLLSPSAKARR